MADCKKITVYFHNGCKAQFDVDNVEFYGQDSVETMRYNCLAKNLLDDGCVLINLNNVSFIQPVQTENEDS